MGQLVTLLIRPEAIRVLANGDAADNQIDAIAEEVLFTGSITRLMAKASGGVLLSASFLTDRSAAALAKGTTVRLGWAASDTVTVG